MVITDLEGALQRKELAHDRRQRLRIVRRTRRLKVASRHHRRGRADFLLLIGVMIDDFHALQIFLDDFLTGQLNVLIRVFPERSEFDPPCALSRKCGSVSRDPCGPTIRTHVGRRSGLSSDRLDRCRSHTDLENNHGGFGRRGESRGLTSSARYDHPVASIARTIALHDFERRPDRRPGSHRHTMSE